MEIVQGNRNITTITEDEANDFIRMYLRAGGLLLSENFKYPTLSGFKIDDCRVYIQFDCKQEYEFVFCQDAIFKDCGISWDSGIEAITQINFLLKYGFLDVAE